MRLVRIFALLLLGYAALVAAFETMIGVMQPADASTLLLATADEEGEHQRVLTRIENNGALYVAANHWPRAWYHRALQNPAVHVTLGDAPPAPYRALDVAAGGKEHARLMREHAHGLAFKLLVGFAPRRFIRLEKTREATP